MGTMGHRVIVALSGGKASAWCADWAFQNYRKEDIVLYFNDTKWEHPDLYRFLDDLSKYFNHPITHDADGRNPEQLFNDGHAMANNRMPFCSRILKAKRLHKFYNDGDIIIFGIGKHEEHREDRINGVYLDVGNKRKAWADLRFPLIENSVERNQVDDWLTSTGIGEPEIYKLGFEHNNCFSGDTKFLTQNGWMTFKKTEGKRLKVLGTGSRWVDADVKSFGVKNLKRLTLKRHNVTKDIFTTEDHIWFVWKGNRCKDYTEKKTCELKAGDRVVTQYPRGLPKDIVYSTWGIAHGFVFGDGTRTRREKNWVTPAWVRLCGEKDKSMTRYFNNSPMRNVDGDVIVSGLPRYFKDMPDINESKSYLAGWLTGYFAADGHITKNASTITLSSAKKENLVFAQDVASIIGVATGNIRHSMRKGFNEHESALYSLPIFRHSLDERFFLIEEHKARFKAREEDERRKLQAPRSQGHRAMVSWVVDSVTDTDRKEKVYCAVVPDGNAFTIDGHIFTHNCSGGCVRAGKKQWKMLYEKLPAVYLDRERMEEEFMIRHNKRATIFKDESLKEFRHRIETGRLSRHYHDEPEGNNQLSFECVGICDAEN